MILLDNIYQNDLKNIIYYIYTDADLRKDINWKNYYIRS